MREKNLWNVKKQNENKIKFVDQWQKKFTIFASLSQKKKKVTKFAEWQKAHIVKLVYQSRLKNCEIIQWIVEKRKIRNLSVQSVAKEKFANKNKCNEICLSIASKKTLKLPENS